MKSLITTLLLVITLSSTVFGDDFSDGYSAYKKGDYKTAMRLWKPLAEQGHANAQTNLGLMYDNGDGVPEDDKQAVKWYRLAASPCSASKASKPPAIPTMSIPRH